MTDQPRISDDQHNNAPAVPDETIAAMWSLYAGTNTVMRLERSQFVHLVRIVAKKLIAATPASAPAQEPDDGDVTGTYGLLPEHGWDEVPKDRPIKSLMQINVRIDVPPDWANRGDMQTIVEREVKAERWAWFHVESSPAQERCHLCDCTGDIHDPTGEWRGECPHCKPAQEVGLTEEDVNAAAKVLAERFDYPWEHMPEEGRKNMRVQARAVVEAALRAKGGQVMIHYQGLPITPETAAVEAIKAGHAFVSFRHSDQLRVAVEVAQSFAIDNGAFSAWKEGKPVTDWSPFYSWADDCRRIPSCDFAVIPDVIDGDEAANEALLAEWPLPRWFGAPVWHLHESLERLEHLANEWPRVCIGSSGEFATVGTQAWWTRMYQAMRVICDDMGRPSCKLHGLRMLDPAIFTRFPFASADSTNIGRNIGIDKRWKGPYPPAGKAARAQVMRGQIEAHNAPPSWDFHKVEDIQEQAVLL